VRVSRRYRASRYPSPGSSCEAISSLQMTKAVGLLAPFASFRTVVTMNSARLILVANQKGGVGKSTVSQNLAAEAHIRGQKTLLLDLDTQGTSFDWYARRSAQSRLRGLAVQKADKVWTLAQFADMSKGFDLVVCDAPGKMSNISAAAAVAADLVVVPMRVGWGEWWAADENELMLDRADEVRKQLGRTPVRRVYMLNEVRPNVTETKAMVAALSDKVDLLRTSLGVGEATVTFEPTSAAAKEVAALFESVMELVEGVNDGGERAALRAS